MKIEKVNDHQIRCTLTKADLIDRELKISELAYGTEKAKTLFRDMMQQASYECGFEAENIPLMIEAIPLNSECIVLIITKVEDPEELEEKFSKFGNIVNKYDDYDEEYDDYIDVDDENEQHDYENELINCFDQLNEIIAEADQSSSEFIPLHELLKKRRRAKEHSGNQCKKP